MLRSLSLQLRGEPETQLPLTREEDLIKTDDVLDLSESLAGDGRVGAGRDALVATLAPVSLGRSGCDLCLLPPLICHQKLTECAHPVRLKEGRLFLGPWQSICGLCLPEPRWSCVG